MFEQCDASAHASDNINMVDNDMICSRIAIHIASKSLAIFYVLESFNITLGGGGGGGREP